MFHARITLRRMMFAIAIIAVLFWIAVLIHRESSPTPARWAERIANRYAKAALRLKDQNKNKEKEKDYAWCLGLARQYAELAESFKLQGVDWQETASPACGPFSDQLTLGQTMVVRQNAKARLSPPTDEPMDSDGELWSVLEPERLWTIPQGTICLVAEEYETYVYADVALRPIRVRILDGHDRGKLVFIQRIYLRRGP